MRPAAMLAAALCVVLAGCRGAGTGAPQPQEDFAVSVTAPSEGAEFGSSFPLEVHRVWTEDLVPEEWSDAVLAPLSVQPAGVEVRKDGKRVLEVRRFAARAFRLDEVVVKPIELKATPRGGGPVRTATSDELRIEVKSALPAEAGDVELPPGPLEPPLPWRRWLLIALAVLAAAALAVALFLRLRRRKPRVAPVPVVPADVRALARLAALAAVEPADMEALQSFYVEASSIVRDYVEERFAVRAPEMTTEEFLSSEETARALEPERRVLLAEFLGHCDLVKFARHVPSRADREQLLRSAERFVEETRPGAVAKAKEVA